jgi:hypothetical protein
MDIASVLEPVHGQPDLIVPSSAPSTSQQHHYALISLPLPRSLQQAQPMSSASSTTSSECLPVQNNSNSTTPEALSASSPPTGTSPRHRRRQIKAACIPCRKRKTKVCYRLVAFLYVHLCIHPHLCQLQRSQSSNIHATQCDGKRPSCKCCTSKVTMCNYSVVTGMTQQQAIRIQLEVYKHVLMLLRTGDSQEREDLVGLLKKGDTLTEAMIGIGQSLEWAQEQGKWI